MILWTGSVVQMGRQRSVCQRDKTADLYQVRYANMPSYRTFLHFMRDASDSVPRQTHSTFL